jgi:hypothetical protein
MKKVTTPMQRCSTFLTTSELTLNFRVRSSPSRRKQPTRLRRRKNGGRSWGKGDWRLNMTLTFSYCNEQSAPIDLCLKIIFLTFYTTGQDKIIGPSVHASLRRTTRFFPGPLDIMKGKA